jgi:hypothetical protein
MPGTWIARLGERLLHGETFALVLSPAIADLQFEAPAHTALRLQQNVAVLKAFAAALGCDIASDVLSLRDDISTVATLTLLQASYYSFMLVLLSGFGSGRVAAHHLDETAAAHAIVIIAIVIACLVPTMACFWPSRRALRIDPDPVR